MNHHSAAHTVIMTGRTEETVPSTREKKTNCSQYSLRPGCKHRHSQSTHFKFSYRTKSSFLTSWLWSTTSVVVMFSCMTMCMGAAAVFKDECDPNDPSACSFGAICQKNIRMRESYYRCTCPQINCYSSGLYDPICATDGVLERMYFNPLCLMLQQCVQQKPIEAICNGICDATCKESSELNMPHEHCPPKDFGFCQNGGFCIHHRKMNISSCRWSRVACGSIRPCRCKRRCQESFGGERCEMKEMPSKSNEGGKCNSQYEVISIFAITLLAVVLLGIMIGLWLRNRKSHDKLWNRCEKDETTPLREDARSESIFPSKLKTKNSNGK